MKKKQEMKKKLLFDGLGFPIILLNVPMVMIRGEMAPDINYSRLQKAVLLQLCHKKSPLTGNEVKFIRKFFSLTTKEFGYIFGHTHSAILKWESQKNRVARIAPTTEFYLRLYVLEAIQKHDLNIRMLYAEIQIPQLAEHLKVLQNRDSDPLSIDVLKEHLTAA